MQIIKSFHHCRRFYWRALESNGRITCRASKLEKDPAMPAGGRMPSGQLTARAKAQGQVRTARSKNRLVTSVSADPDRRFGFSTKSKGKQIYERKERI